MKHKAFTLIELLIVITILGILATLAVPRITMQVQTAKATEAMQFFGMFRRFASDCLSVSGGKLAPCLTASQLGIEIPNNTFFLYQSAYIPSTASTVPYVPAQSPSPSPSATPIPAVNLKGAKIIFRAKREDPPGTYLASICMQLTLDAKGNVDTVELSTDPAQNPFSAIVARTGAEDTTIACDKDFAPMK